MTDKMSEEKVALLARVRRRGRRVPHRGAARAPRLLLLRRPSGSSRETPGAFRPDQYSNPANPAEHERSTGPEIWRQTAGRITHFVAGIGTGGTITGVGRYLKSQNPDVQIVGADPEGSVYSGGTGRPYLVEGVGEDFWPTTYDPSVVDRVIEVTDAESFARGPPRHPRGGPPHRRVVRHRGARRARGRRASSGPTTVVVVLLPDSGRGYLSKIFDDDWMIDFGFLRMRRHRPPATCSRPRTTASPTSC